MLGGRRRQEPRHPGYDASVHLDQVMEMMKSRSFRPEWFLGILALLGLVYYAEVWIGYLAFYRSLGVTPEAAGVRYPALVMPTAILVFLLILVLVGSAAVLFALGVRSGPRAAGVQLILGCLLIIPVIWYGPAPKDQLSIGNTFHLVVILFGILMFSAGLIDILGYHALRRLTHCRHLWRVKRLRQRLEGALDGQEAQVIVGWMTSRRRARRGWKKWKKDLREAGRLPLAILIAAIAFTAAALPGYLLNAGEHAARDLKAGKSELFVSDPWAALFLRIKMQRCSVIALDSRFQGLERATLTCLGGEDGTYLLYDFAQRRVLQVPSASVAIQIKI
jgi:hypothetical protein